MLTDTEANEAYSRLLETLRDNGLQWLANDISQDIAEGKSLTTTLAVPDFSARDTWRYQAPEAEDPFGRARRKRAGPKSEFTKVIPFTPAERLAKAVQATLAIVSGAAAAQDAILQEISN